MVNDASNDAKNGRVVGGTEQPEDNALDRALRPQTLDDLIGQDKVRDNLRTMIYAAKARGEALDHVLIYGPPGLGKCITGDSLVLSGAGLAPLSAFVPEHLPAGVYQPLTVTVQGIHGPESTSHVYANGKTRTIRVKTQAGFELEGTPNHRVLVATPLGPEWKRLDQLTKHDYVAIARDTQLWGPAQRLDDQPTFRAGMSDASALRRSLADMAGLDRRTLHTTVSAQRGDLAPVSERTAANDHLATPSGQAWQDQAAIPGTPANRHSHTTTGQHRWCAEGEIVAGSDQAGQSQPDGLGVLARAELNPDQAYGIGRLIGSGTLQAAVMGPAHDIGTRGAGLHAHAAQSYGEARIVASGEVLGGGGGGQNPDPISPDLGQGQLQAQRLPSWEKASEIGVPAAVLRSDAAVVRGFLQGLFDAGGDTRGGPSKTSGKVDYSTRSRSLSQQVQVILANFGIIARRTSQDHSGRTVWRLNISGHDADRFACRIGSRLTDPETGSESGVDCVSSQSHAHIQADSNDPVPCAGLPLAALVGSLGQQPRFLPIPDVQVGGHVRSRAALQHILRVLPGTLLTHPARQALDALCNPRYFWDAVASTEPGEAAVFDFVVPGSHSFTANGFVNHNTTLSHVIGNEMNATVRVTSGPAIERQGDLAAILTNLRANDILFVDEIHRLNRAVEEILYPAMEDYALDIVIGKGPSARSVRLKLPPITIIGATTRLALMTAPLRARFGATFRVDFYPPEAIEKIVSRAARLLNTQVDQDALTEIAKRSRGTPRVALRMLRRVRDYAQVKSDGHVTAALAREALNALEVDPLGLDDLDRRVLRAIIEKFNGGPVGLETIAASISEESDTIMDVVEPYLLQLGFLDRTPRGRTATQRAYDHLHIPFTPPVQPSLL